MRKTECRRLFKNVIGVNPTRYIKRRISVAQLLQEQEYEREATSEPIVFLGHVFRDGEVHLADPVSFIPQGESRHRQGPN